MNTTVAIILPVWLVYIIGFGALLNMVNELLKLYIKYLERKIAAFEEDK